jgi:hypothetical protein
VRTINNSTCSTDTNLLAVLRLYFKANCIGDYLKLLNHG